MPHTRVMTAALVLITLGALSACGTSGASSGSNGAAKAAAGGARPAVGGGASGASGSAAGTAGGAGGAGAPSRSAPATAQLGASVTAAQPKIIKNGTIDLLVSAGDLRPDFARLTAIGTAGGGFVASSSLQTGRHPSATITLRVPVALAPKTMVTIDSGRFGKVSFSSLTGRDVTGQVVEVDVEITNLTSEEKAVRVLLDKAGSVRNILTIQQELFQLQGEIQQLTAQSNSLDNHVEYATVKVNLSTKAPAVVAAAKSHPSTLARFWHLATSHCVDAVRGIVLAIGWAAPLLIGVVMVALGWLVWRRRRRPQGSATA